MVRHFKYICVWDPSLWYAIYVKREIYMCMGSVAVVRHIKYVYVWDPSLWYAIYVKREIYMCMGSVAVVRLVIRSFFRYIGLFFSHL